METSAKTAMNVNDLFLAIGKVRAASGSFFSIGKVMANSNQG